MTCDFLLMIDYCATGVICDHWDPDQWTNDARRMMRMRRTGRRTRTRTGRRTRTMIDYCPAARMIRDYWIRINPMMEEAEQ